MEMSDVESVITRSLGLPAGASGAAKSAATGSGEGAAPETASPEPAAARVTLSTRALPKTIVNSYEKVELSQRVPQQIPVATMKASGEIAETLLQGENVSRSDQKALREDRVLAALTGMRILQQQAGVTEKVWLSGIPRPSEAEMQEAYRRLTQRLSSPGDTKELLVQNAERVGLLETFRDRDFSGFSEEATLAA